MRLPACLLLTITAIALTACGGGSSSSENTSGGALITDPIHLDSAGVDSATINLKIGVGELTVSGGAAALVDGKIEYNVPAWKPQITQSKDGRSAHLTIEQPSSDKSSGDNKKNRWTLQVADTTPVTFEIECGVGSAKLNLGTMQLRGVTINVGVGQMDLDLRGHPDHDYNVKVHGGVGETTIYVPAGASVRATAQGGLAPVKIEGLEVRGDAWQSPDYGKVQPTINLEVDSGIGQIRIVR